ncbi:MAG: hypothetical protein RL477_2030 [Pseudomonadota bacterium]
MKAPEFWREGGAWPLLLAPAGFLYGLAGRAERAFTRPQKASVPVICIGNLTAGGNGKTPVAIAVAHVLAGAGRIPHFLTRGYGGSAAGPLRVDAKAHGPAEVGDEALLLALSEPTWVARDRVAGAKAAAAAGARTVVLDDGFQDPRLAKDVSLVVADGEAGFGNGRIIPAGPLREDVAGGLRRASALVIVGADRWGVAALAARFAPNLPVLTARPEPAPDAARLEATRVYGFAGIGIPEKFLATLREIGAEVAGFRAFDDHHPYTARDLALLRSEAAAKGARLVTTAKDAIRLPADARKEVDVVEVTARFADEAALAAVLGISPRTRR